MSALTTRSRTIGGLVGLLALLRSAAAIGGPPQEGPKDKEASELAKKAIDTDYLGTKFADAEQKLKKALALCEQASACSAKVRADLLCRLGVVYIGGMSRVDDGRAQFVAALKEDPSVVPDPDLVSPEIEAAFAEAKAGKTPPPKKPDAPPKPPAPAPMVGDLVHTPPAGQATLTPLPVYAELPAGTMASRVQLSYKPFGATEWKATVMKRVSKGYGVEIPCTEVGSAQGELSYFIQAFDADNNIVSWSGSRSAPNRVKILPSIEGEALHLPGQPPPMRCADVGDCPPDFPGCHAKKSDEPPPCEPGTECPTAPPPIKKNWLSLAVQQDLLAVSGNKKTCAGPPDSDYVCFDASGGYYGGIPYPKSGDEVRGGLSAATTRILVGYDRVIGNFTVGARIGFALRGGPKSPEGRAFLPFHGEVRGAYWFGRDPFARKGVRPYVVLGGGVAQVDGSVGVVIYESTQAFTDDKRTHLDAWKKAGTGFITGGVGILAPITPRMGPLFEVKYLQLLGASAPALSLSLGYALGL